MERRLTKVLRPLLASLLVTRFAATSVTYGMDMLIDINTDVYPLKANDRFTLVFASTLYRDNRPDPGTYTDYSKEVGREWEWFIRRRPLWTTTSTACTERCLNISLKRMEICLGLGWC